MTTTLAVTVEVALDGAAMLGEGPVWHAERQHLLWVDITAGAGHHLDPLPARTPCALGQDVGAVVLRESGGLVAAVRDGLLAVADDGSTERLLDLEADIPGNRCNDGKCDSAGRIWVGTMPTDDSGRLARSTA